MKRDIKNAIEIFGRIGAKKDLIDARETYSDM
jgi:hypothetical protein